MRDLPAGGKAGTADLAAPVRAGTGLTGEQAIALFDAQAGSRHLDLAARYLRAEGHGFYTIGSAGHEADAAVGLGVEQGDGLLAGQPAAQRPDRRAQVAHGTQETPVELFFLRGLRHGIPQP